MKSVATQRFSLDDIDAGAPMLVALATICSKAMLSPPIVRRLPLPGTAKKFIDFSNESSAILVAASDRNIIRLTQDSKGRYSPDPLVYIAVETKDHSSRLFRTEGDPNFAVRCLDGFVDLCRHGLVFHHHGRIFSINPIGLEVVSELLAQDGDQGEIKGVLDQTTERDS